MSDKLHKFETYNMKNISTGKDLEYTFLKTQLQFKDERTGKTVILDQNDVFGDSPLVELPRLKSGGRRTRNIRKRKKTRKSRKH